MRLSLLGFQLLGTEGTRQVLHSGSEDMYMAYFHSQAQFREQRILDLEVLGNVVGRDIRPYLSYLPGLAVLLALRGTYV